MSDSELREQLARRRKAAPLSHVQRAELIEAIHSQAAASAQSRHEGFGWRLLSVTAALTTVVLVVVLAFPRPESSPMASSSAAPQGTGFVLSTEQLAHKVAARDSIGEVVLADTRFGPDLRLDRCAGQNPCFARVVADTNPPLQVDLAEYTEPVVPDQPTVMAFRIQDGYVTFLGQASVKDAETAWSVSDVIGQAGSSGVLFAVDGWLVRTLIPSCPAPADISSNPDLSYYCDGSWITPEKIYSVVERTANSINGRLTFDGALHVQSGAYNDFAQQPEFGELGAEPRHGAYLVQVAGCPANHTGDCPVWTMLGRLEQSAPATETPAPTPTIETQLAFKITTEAELVAMAASARAFGTVVVSDAPIYGTTGPSPLDASELTEIGVIGPDRQTFVIGRSTWDGSVQYHAFRVLSGQLEYLGAVSLAAAGSFSVPDLVALALAPEKSSAKLYPVDAWLVQSGALPCPAPPDFDSPQDYWCGGSWLSETAVAMSDGHTSVTGGLHVQWDAYRQYAADPQIGADGGEARHGIYLIKAAGCPANVMGDCPVWEMVGRLEPPEADSVSPAPTPASVTPSPSAAAPGARLDPSIARPSSAELLGLPEGSLVLARVTGTEGTQVLSISALSPSGEEHAIGDFAVPDGLRLLPEPLDQRTAAGRLGPTGFLALAGFKEDSTSEVWIYDLSDAGAPPRGPYPAAHFAWSPRGLISIVSPDGDARVLVVDPTDGSSWYVSPELDRGVGYMWTTDGAGWLSVDLRNERSWRLGITSGLDGTFSTLTTPQLAYAAGSYFPLEYSAAGEEWVKGGFWGEDGPVVVMSGPPGETDSLAGGTIWFDGRTDEAMPLWLGWDTDGVGMLALFDTDGQAVLARYDAPGERQTLGVLDPGPSDPATAVQAIHQVPGELRPDVVLEFANRGTTVWYSGVTGEARVVSSSDDELILVGWILATTAPR